MNALEYREVEKYFGETRAVDGVSFSVEGDQIFGLLGPNGAGKTSLIRTTMGIYLPDRGSVSIFGRGLKELGDGDLGYLPEERGLYPKMKCADLLIFFLELKGVAAKAARKKAFESLEKVGLGEYSARKVEELSKGMQQKVQLLTAINHSPRLAILDEPFSGLDPVNVELFKEIIKDAKAQGMTIVLSSHQMELVEQLCNNIALINKGKIVLMGDVGEIRKQYGEKEIHLEFGGLMPEADLSEFTEWERREANSMTLCLKDGINPRAVLDRVWASGGEVVRFESAKASLHEIFVRVVREGEVRNEN
ncbi:MAG TPA: ATP-binding cassette domain-containing protein [Acidobacteriota bacterium]|nr:ATP-binding cassette domain-containing protein [Acidobacteriota bacterium]HNT18226.1 ATP-binding cassette domain-containing protein [Acidobacteriota bacterium]HPA27313.1 ATP-binding cassette domain-containing protein [Acidobacteriota bacterium]HQO20740.1 ATP-binding cassette domain-containing protein [Acidobacteriota bacterium]HQQ45789.1 ATP-binding cassette domain-containing protein [Acidobacteriota bacterium]